jgi:hypothetical protein
MKYVEVSDEYVAGILEANHLKAVNVESVVESQTEVVEDINEEVEDHVCPLCESHLDEELSETALQECVDFIMETINELTEEDGESLEESEEDEVEYED